MGRPAGFFDVEERLAGLSKKGDDLERLAAVIDFELFRPELERAVPRADRSKGGRPPFDHVLMFKVLILQTQNNLSDERTEFYLRDRLTWMRFLGLGLGDPVPDANTIWTFREALTKPGAALRLFELFDRELRSAGYLAMSGQLVDATIVAPGRTERAPARGAVAPRSAHPARARRDRRHPQRGPAADGPPGDSPRRRDRCARSRSSPTPGAPTRAASRIRREARRHRPLHHPRIGAERCRCGQEWRS